MSKERLNFFYWKFEVVLVSAATADDLTVLSQVLLDNVQSLSHLTKIFDDNNGAAAYLAWFTFFVDFAQTGPFAQLPVRINANQGNLMFMAECCDKFLVEGLIEGLGQNAQNSLTPKIRNKKIKTSVP